MTLSQNLTRLAAAGAFLVLVLLAYSIDTNSRFFPAHTHLFSTAPLTVYDEVKLPLDEAIQRHAGVYKNEAARSKFVQIDGHITQESVDKTVLMSSTNWGFMDFVVNWFCSADVVGPYKPFLLAADDMAYQYMLYLGISTRASIDFGVPFLPSAAQSYGSGDYVALCRTRINMILYLLQQGKNVFFADMDIVWLGDPVVDLIEGIDFQYGPDFSGLEHKFKDVDGGQPNMGMHFFRTNEKTILFVKDLLATLNAENSAHDQLAVHAMLIRLKSQGRATYLVKPVEDIAKIESAHPSNFLVTALSSALYPPGVDWVRNASEYQNVWTESGRPGVATPKSAHANWLIGSEMKRAAFRNRGLWLIDDEALAADMKAFEAAYIAGGIPKGKSAAESDYQRFCVREPAWIPL